MTEIGDPPREGVGYTASNLSIGHEVGYVFQDFWAYFPFFQLFDYSMNAYTVECLREVK